MIANVLSTPILQKKITELAEKRLLVEEKEGLLNKDDPLYASKRNQRRLVIEQGLQELSEKLTGNMICKMESKPFIRGAYYLATQLLTRAYHQGMKTGISRPETVGLRVFRNSRLERRSSASPKSGSKGRERQTKHHLLAMPSISCGLCFFAVNLL